MVYGGKGEWVEGVPKRWDEGSSLPLPTQPLKTLPLTPSKFNTLYALNNNQFAKRHLLRDRKPNYVVKAFVCLI